MWTELKDYVKNCIQLMTIFLSFNEIIVLADQTWTQLDSHILEPHTHTRARPAHTTYKHIQLGPQKRWVSFIRFVSVLGIRQLMQSEDKTRLEDLTSFNVHRVTRLRPRRHRKVNTIMRLLLRYFYRIDWSVTVRCNELCYRKYCAWMYMCARA